MPARNRKPDKVRVEVAYALPDHQRLLALEVPPQATVRQAIEQSGLLAEFPLIDLTTDKVGVFSQVVKLDDSLREGDRVEIYRSLVADPKEMRRERAAKKAAEPKKTG